MNSSPGSFRAALAIGWIALSAAGVLFARSRGIPILAALPVIAAFLVEYPFYLAIGFGAVRERLPGARLPLFLVASAALPYLACCCGAIPFEWTSLARVCAMALVMGLWYRALPASAPADIGFLAVALALTIGKFFDAIYPDFYHQKLLILGHAALIQIAVAVLILERRMPDFGYGFWPDAKEWRIGALHFFYFAVIAVPLIVALKAVRFTPPATPLIAAGKLFGAFAGALWFVALSEEFFFRGVLMQWIEDWTWSRTAALVMTSVLFGLVHISFQHIFPNWHWVLITSILGWFCARARMEGGSIRAAMVTHALAVAVYTGFLR